MGLSHQLHQTSLLYFLESRLGSIVNGHGHLHSRPGARPKATSKCAPNANVSTGRPIPSLGLSPPHSLELALLIPHELLPADATGTPLIALPPGILTNDLILFCSKRRRSELLRAQLADQRRAG